MLRSFGEGRMFFTAVFHPDDDKQNVVLAGCADKKIHQWDADTGDLVQVMPCPGMRNKIKFSSPTAYRTQPQGNA